MFAMMKEEFFVNSVICSDSIKRKSILVDSQPDFSKLSSFAYTFF